MDMADDTKPTVSNPQMDLNPPVVSAGMRGKETAPVSETKPDSNALAKEVLASPETGPELEGYVENVDKKAQLPPTLVDDYTGQVLLRTADPQNATVTLPLTQTQVEEGLHHKVWESVRWLSEWCVRQIKLLNGRARYKAD